MRRLGSAAFLASMLVRCLFPSLDGLSGGDASSDASGDAPGDASPADVAAVEAGPIAYVQQSTSSLFPPAQVTLPGAVAAGDTLVVCSAFPLDFGSMQVSDSLGRTFALVASRDGIGAKGGRSLCYVSIGGPGGDDTISLTTTNATLADGAVHDLEAYVFEYRNIGALDDTLTAAGLLEAGVDASWDAGSITAAGPNELLFAWVEGSYAAHLDPSFTSLTTLDDNNVGDKLVPVQGSYAVAGSANYDWVTVAATFK